MVASEGGPAPSTTPRSGLWLLGAGEGEWKGVFHGPEGGRSLSSYQLFGTRGSLECVAFGFRHDVAAGSGNLITAFVTLGSGAGFTV